MKPLSTLERLLALSAICLLVSTPACAPEDEESGSSADEVKLEGRDLPTALTSLRAGDEFVPGLDETVLQIGAPCVDGAVATITGASVFSSASVVQNRDTLARELGLDATFPIPDAPGLTGSIGISKKTTFDRQSVVLLLQSTGTYKSVLKKIASNLPAFSPKDVSRCGYGYVTEANHRVTAALVITIRSNDESSDVKASAGFGKSDVAQVKGTLSNIINKGNLEISVRYSTDIIPGLPEAPIGDGSIAVTNDSGKQAALTKIEQSLNWLGQAHNAIQTYLGKLQNGAEATPAAPTQSVRFRFYPSTPAAMRKTLETAADNVLGVRRSMNEADGMIDRWQQFAADADKGAGYAWNVPANPAGSIDELKARKRELLDNGGGKLGNHRAKLDAQLDGCLTALRNEDGNEDVASTIGRACTAAPGLPFDKNANELRPIAYVKTFESNADGKCPAGYRRPYETEYKVFAPWSRFVKATNKDKRGIWLDKRGTGCNFSSPWIYDGGPTCTNPFTVTIGRTVCVSNEKGPTPAE